MMINISRDINDRALQYIVGVDKKLLLLAVNTAYVYADIQKLIKLPNNIHIIFS